MTIDNKPKGLDQSLAHLIKLTDAMHSVKTNEELGRIYVKSAQLVSEIMLRDNLMLEALERIRKLPKSHDSIQQARDIIDELFAAINGGE